ncbi:hypothetical protein FSP39_000270 [Pinctada imbricata]|uniref:Uncharacterized protein n=1 Tax=Pinctada imbricata TaxID=66713 RepID=A0AA88YU49_PINIB|nr:hypothetical protein FSP39_000270 [Pinctada imbricata]
MALPGLPKTLYLAYRIIIMFWSSSTFSENGRVSAVVVCSLLTSKVPGSNLRFGKRVLCGRAEEVKKTIGDVTILVNNAGVVFGKHVVDICDEEMEIILNTNCLSHIWSIKAFLPGMMSSQRGHIVSMNSMLGLMGMRGCGDYCTSKHAATGLYESLWWELEDCQGIRLTSIHPYTVSNQMFEGIKIRFPTLFPMLQEDDVARQTVNAVLCNKKHVVIPRIMNFVIWSKR